MKVTSDASQAGLGATLENYHEGQWYPIAFASRTMTSSERNYCQMEKEISSIVFACKKFHDYLIGNRFIVENDHRPLIAIVQKPLSKAPPRIQRFLLSLQRYNFELQYRPGNQMILADALSRSSLNDSVSELSEQELNTFVLGIVSNLSISQQKLAEISSETSKDAALLWLLQLIPNRWPQHRQEPESLRAYFNI